MTAGAPRRPDRAGLVIAVLLALLAAVIFWQTRAMPVTAQYARVGPTTFPYVVAAGLALLAAGTAVSAWRGGFPKREADRVGVQTDRLLGKRDGEPLPMAELVNKLLAAKGVPPVTRTISPALAYAAGATLETLYKMLGKTTEPPITRFVARQLSTAHWYDLTAAKRDLGYAPEVSLNEGLERLARSN